MMELGFLFFFNSILLGIGLAMDAFSVSVVNGFSVKNMERSGRMKMAGAFPQPCLSARPGMATMAVWVAFSEAICPSWSCSSCS